MSTIDTTAAATATAATAATANTANTPSKDNRLHESAHVMGCADCDKRAALAAFADYDAACQRILEKAKSPKG